jgi:hypothetical protein
MQVNPGEGEEGRLAPLVAERKQPLSTPARDRELLVEPAPLTGRRWRSSMAARVASAAVPDLSGGSAAGRALAVLAAVVQ